MSDSSNGPSWISRLSKVFSDEPEGREEILEKLQNAQEQGVIDSDALLMIQGVLEVSEARVRDIMLPRLQIVLIDLSKELDAILEEMLESSHSRYPVMDEGEIVGVLLAKDLFRSLVKGEMKTKEDLRAICREPNFVPESKRLNVLLREFKEGRNHLALVIDEYDELAGLITIEDVLEQIVGNIEDEHDDHDENIKKRAGEIYAVKAITPLDQFNDFFKTQIDDGNSESLGGYVANSLGHVPIVGEEVEAENWMIKVLQATDRRADLFQVSPIQADMTEVANDVNIGDQKVLDEAAV